MRNAIAVIRISSLKQGLQGDSPEHQKSQIEQYSRVHDIHIKKYFVFMESASKAQQPIQEAIDYCKEPKNKVQLLIIKSIDRFTRGGFAPYYQMKDQLVQHGVALIDLYGVIGNQSINTLEHLGVKFPWSIYDPTKKSELLEAERAKDEVRDNLTRMIGAEIQYVREGYWVRVTPLGYMTKRTETTHGRRLILVPHPEESVWIIRMFELKLQATVPDSEIVEKINLLGYRSRRYYLRHPKNRIKIIGIRGELPLTIEHMDDLLKNPIYAGINTEKWTNNRAVKCKFPGLISIETFNQVNQGKIIITREDGEIKILRGKSIPKRIVNTSRSQEFPFRRYVLCPICKHPFYGSSSRGRLGKYYPAYHCSKKNHSYRVPKKKFEETIDNFLELVKIRAEYLPKLQDQAVEEYKKRQKENSADSNTYEQRIQTINTQIKLLIEKLKILNSAIAIKALEEEITQLEEERTSLLSEKNNQSKTSSEEITEDDIRLLAGLGTTYLTKEKDLVKKAQYFSLLFDTAPTYEELLNKTASLNQVFELG